MAAEALGFVIRSSVDNDETEDADEDVEEDDEEEDDRDDEEEHDEDIARRDESIVSVNGR